ncbi:MAG TPA: transketolase [Dongiaceae bacterium]|jgi:transketolase|nr:transketolase [Dongiaceae bacterium]
MTATIEPIQTFARAIRAHALRMVAAAHASHIGSCLSIADILAVLYGSILNVDPSRPRWEGRDRLIVSKGHAAAIVYAALAERGFFPISLLDSYCREGSPLAGHVTHVHVPGVEVSTGSLGHGLSIGCGMALAAKRTGQSYAVHVLLSDGECDEGSIWEAALFAPHHRLDNLVVTVDYNGIQSFGSVKEVLDLDPFIDKWRAFGWQACEIDGHDVTALLEAYRQRPDGKPRVIIARTIKGKGVSFMENQLAWHYKSPKAEELAQALAEVAESVRGAA